MRLGKLPARVDSRTLRLSRYLSPALKPAPKVCSWAEKVVSWPMLGNDRCGDCTIAAAGHLIQEWTADQGEMIVPTEAQVLGEYEAVSGYIPGDESTDHGAVEIDVLNRWRQKGLCGHKIYAYSAVNPRNVFEVQQTIYLFGGAYIGVALPLSAQRQTIWDSVEGQDGEPGSWGGHAVPLVAYTPNTLVCVSWGGLKRMTWRFLQKYCDEFYAPLSPDWVDAKRQSPGGFDLDALEHDLEVVTQ